MTSFRKLIALATLAAGLTVPAAAAAEPAVPPENSAANQYTEAIPTGGGKKDAGGGQGDRSPDQVLGPKRADELRAQGSTGRATAEVAAETAPEVEVASTGGRVAASQTEPQTDSEAVTPPAGGGDAGPASGQTQRSGDPEEQAASRVVVTDLGQPEGSSGLAAVLDEATGSSSGGMPWLLPLMIAAIAAWSAAFAWRQRRQH